MADLRFQEAKDGTAEAAVILAAQNPKANTSSKSSGETRIITKEILRFLCQSNILCLKWKKHLNSSMTTSTKISILI